MGMVREQSRGYKRRERSPTCSHDPVRADDPGLLFAFFFPCPSIHLPDVAPNAFRAPFPPPSREPTPGSAANKTVLQLPLSSSYCRY